MGERGQAFWEYLLILLLVVVVIIASYFLVDYLLGDTIELLVQLYIESLGGK